MQALIPTGIDYFDMHLYSVNMGFLNAGVSYLDQAIAAGLDVAISETWLHKMTDAQLKGQSEYGTIGLFSSVAPIDNYSFWSPLDSEFIGTMVDLAYWKHLLYLSPFEVQLFFAYLDYNQVSGMNSTQQAVQEDIAEVTALNNGVMTFTGQWSGDYIRPGAPATGLSASGSAPVAPGSIVSIYGSNLASTPTSAKSVPLPMNLDGTSATITDSSGVQAGLPLFYAGPLQINAEIPQTASMGAATITITTTSGSQTGSVLLATVAPALFAANQNGKGVPAAQVVTNHANGTQTTALVYGSPCAVGKCQPVPIDLSAGNSALVLYGTGIRNAASLSAVTVTIGSHTLSAFFAGAAPTYVGLDQVNVSLPQSLAGSGTVNVVVSVAGATSNTVQLNFK